MAGETLRTGPDLLSVFPDNNSGLIEAVHSRDHIVSGVSDMAFSIADPTNYTIGTGGGDVLSGFTGTPEFFGRFWRQDANNQFVQDYGGIQIPGLGSGHTRALTGVFYVTYEVSSKESVTSFEARIGSSPAGPAVSYVAAADDTPFTAVVPVVYGKEPADTTAVSVYMLGSDETVIIRSWYAQLVGLLL